ncbi:MAG: cell division FtsZ family protein, partial [Candidatus Altiarchaeota archaeon]|nr:cell division FtsZ family protein [Candidatus Altiarchaeota archaeon]
GSKIVFITCGLGGGTGSGSAAILADIAKDMGITAVACVTLPFRSEGMQRWKNAEYALKKLQHIADTVIVIPNDKLLDLVPDMPLNAAFQYADMLLGNTLKGMIDLVTKPGLVNRDLADLRSILNRAGVAVMGVGESNIMEEHERMIEAAELAMRSPLLNADVATADKVLINISGGRNMKLDGVNTVIEYVMSQVQPGADLFWGVQIDETLNSGTTRVMVITGGIKASKDIPLIVGARKATAYLEKRHTGIMEVDENVISRDLALSI